MGWGSSWAGTGLHVEGDRTVWSLCENPEPNACFQFLDSSKCEFYLDPSFP